MLQGFSDPAIQNFSLDGLMKGLEGNIGDFQDPCNYHEENPPMEGQVLQMNDSSDFTSSVSLQTLFVSFTQSKISPVSDTLFIEI